MTTPTKAELERAVVEWEKKLRAEFTGRILQDNLFSFDAKLLRLASRIRKQQKGHKP